MSGLLMTAEDYRESLRELSPRVFVNGRAVESVADDPSLAPGIAAIGVTYEMAHVAEHRELMTARTSDGRTVNRMLYLGDGQAELLAKLEAVRVLCQECGCAQRYLVRDALGALSQATFAADGERGTEYHERVQAYLHEVQDRDLALGIAMTDAKGDRSRRPAQQRNKDVYVRIAERRAEGIVIRGTKAIVTGAPYMHELLVMPCRTMRADDRDFAVCCAVPIDSPGVTVIARPAGSPGERAASFSARYGQSTGVVIFDDVLVPWERVFLAGECEQAGLLTTAYATHHRHTCIAARAGFGDLLIGAAALITEANGLDPDDHPHVREKMVQLIAIVEGFYACGVAASTYATTDPSGVEVPDAIFANIGKLLLSTQIYDMQRLAHELAGGLIVALPGPDEDHNPHTQAALAEVLGGRDDIPAARRLQVARMIEDLTASYQGGWYSVISLHGGGSPEAMKREIWRNYPIPEKAALVDHLLDRGLSADHPASTRQPGRCCATGCRTADGDNATPLHGAVSG